MLRKVYLVSFVLAISFMGVLKAAKDPGQDQHVITTPEVTLTNGTTDVLPCLYGNSVFAVYWKKGEQLSNASILVVLNKTGERWGPGFDDGRFSITDNFSLVIHKVQVEDDGRYFCEISDLETGNLFNNKTDVVVVDDTLDDRLADDYTGIIVAITVAGCVVFALVVLFLLWLRRRMTTKENGKKDSVEDSEGKRGEDIPDTAHEKTVLIKEDILDPLVPLREGIERYEPGKATDIEIDDTPQINIGIFGSTSSGKSAFINSLLFAITGKYHEMCEETSMFEPASKAEERKAVPLTKSVHAFEIRKIRDFDESNYSRLAEMESDGVTLMPDPIHCPVFVYDYRPFSIKPAGKFISTICDEWRCIYGEQEGKSMAMVIAITRESEHGDIEGIRTELSEVTTVPVENIWSFENYTNTSYDNDDKKSKKYLEFLWECLKKGESNVKLQKTGFQKQEVAGIAETLFGSATGVIDGSAGGATGVGVSAAGVAAAASNENVKKKSKFAAFMRAGANK